MSKLICLDFDGVIHSYTSKWSGPTVISDPPVEGALDFIRDLQAAGLQVAIYSTRNTSPGAIDAMKEWLIVNELEIGYVSRIQFPTEKPTLASLFIDDRAFHFTGMFPPVSYCREFKPWNKQ